jgi:ferrochelatase
VLLTAHSMPKSVIDREPVYIEQVKETVRLVAAEARLPHWYFAYQSAGHTPEEWLKPDMKDLMPELAAKGYHSVVLAPVQFLTDHLEILYDIDVAGREEAHAAGLCFARIESLNLHPLFIRALAEVVRRELTKVPVG